MTNADLFLVVFHGLMATELWAKPESEFLEWLNAKANTDGIALFARPKKMWRFNGVLYCPQCGAVCKSYYHFCNDCGQAVKLDERQ